jgi:hypothetical protein
MSSQTCDLDGGGEESIPGRFPSPMPPHQGCASHDQKSTHRLGSLLQGLYERSHQPSFHLPLQIADPTRWASVMNISRNPRHVTSQVSSLQFSLGSTLHLCLFMNLCYLSYVHRCPQACTRRKPSVATVLPGRTYLTERLLCCRL